MKRYRPIKAAIQPAINRGTKFYSATLDQIIDAYSNRNCFVLETFRKDGLSAINIDDNLYGSIIDEDTIYICVTDGRDIIVNDVPTDPEAALSEYGIDELSEYIEPASDSIIARYITELEIDTPDFDAIAPSIIRSGTDFTKMVSDYNEFLM